jgi:aspartate aminotransferase
VSQPTGFPRLSQRIAAIEESATLAVDAKAKSLKAAGHDVIGFGAGEPDFPTPAHIVAAAVEAAPQAKNHRYTPAAGLPELREAIAVKTAKDSGYEAAASQVLVTNGAKHAVYNSFAALLDPGDEVLLPAPYWVTYPEAIRLAGGVPVVVPTDESTGFRAMPEALEAACTERTKVLLFVSPSNPTGAIYSRDEVEAIGRFAVERELWVVTDEMYEHFVYGGGSCPSMPVVVPELADRCVVINAVSKAYAMTGWRIGYAAGPEHLVKAMDFVQGQQTSGASTIAQWAAVEALEGPQDHLQTFRKAFEDRRDLVVSMLNQANGLKCPTPEGAFYVYPSCAEAIGRKAPSGKTIGTDEDFVTELLETEGVATVHGTAFGLGPNFRVSYATSNAMLEEACSRIQRFCGALR